MTKTRWDLYRENVKKYWRYRGGNPYKHGSTLPTKEQIEKMNNFGIIADIDTPIRDVVIELNENGLKTYGSCSGHWIGSRGFISFGDRREFNEKLAVKILKKHRLKRMVLEKPGMNYCGKEKIRSAGYAITFTAVDPVKGNRPRYRGGFKVPKRLRKNL